MEDYSKFIFAIEAYYGPYASKAKKEIVLEYVMNRYPESDLDKLFKQLIINYPSQYKTPPDVNVIHDLTSDNIEAEALNAWDILCKKANPYKDIVFADKRIYAVLRAMGGHVHFSKREEKDEVWTQKRFIELFKMYTKSPPEVMTGTIMRGLGTAKKDYILIGNEDKCREIIAGQGTRLVEDMTKNIKAIGAAS